MPSDRVRVGVAGLGVVAQACHLPILDRLAARFEVSAVADLSPTLRDRLGTRYRVDPARRLANGEELLDTPDLDAVLVLTAGSHAALCRSAIERGLPVFSEKPLAYTRAEVDELEASIARHAGRLELGYMKLHDPAVERARAAIARRGDESPLRSIEVTVLHPPGEPQLAHAHVVGASDLPPEPVAALAAETARLQASALGAAVPEWIARLYTDVLLGSVVHDLALVRAFAADPVAIDHVAAWSPGAWPPSLAVEGRLPGGARLSIRWHYLSGYPAYREGLRLVWDDASIELEFPAPYLLNAPTSIRIVEADGGSRRDTAIVSYAEAFENELLAFHRLVVDGTPPAAGAAEGRADVVTCERIARRLAEDLGLPIGGEAAEIPTAEPDADATAPRDGVRAQSSWATKPS